jgi:hypothetical protein
MRRVLFSILTIAVLVGAGIAIGRFLPSSANPEQSVAPQIVTVPVLITATLDPNETPQVIIITATPGPGSTVVSALPTGVADAASDGTEQVVPTLDPTLLSADSILQATVTALPENCILHTLADGEFPSLVAEQYGADLFEMLAVNGLNDDTSRFLQIGDVLIVPLEGCPLTPAQVLAVTGLEAGAVTEEATEEATAESTAESTEGAEPTVQPTITLPPTAVNAQVQIVRVMGGGDITSEGVEIRNTGGVVDLTGWTLEDTEGNVFTFPEQRLFTNGLVTVYTRRGTNTPIALYWGRSAAAWGEPGDSVTLADADGDVQATLRLGAASGG